MRVKQKEMEEIQKRKDMLDAKDKYAADLDLDGEARLAGDIPSDNENDASNWREAIERKGWGMLGWFMGGTTADKVSEGIKGSHAEHAEYNKGVADGALPMRTSMARMSQIHEKFAEMRDLSRSKAGISKNDVLQNIQDEEKNAIRQPAYGLDGSVCGKGAEITGSTIQRVGPSAEAEGLTGIGAETAFNNNGYYAEVRVTAIDAEKKDPNGYVGVGFTSLALSDLQKLQGGTLPGRLDKIPQGFFCSGP